MRLAYAPYMLDFKEPAGTSRGILTQKPTCLLKIYDESNPDIYGIGEAALFPGLSPEAGDRFGYKMLELFANVAIGRPTDLSEFSSIQYGFEQALRDFASGGTGLYFDSPFVAGTKSIEINGLIWMGDFDTMISRIDKKISEGFRCVKMKIGAIDWEKELEMVAYVRSNFKESTLEIRLDANGAFPPDEALDRLKQLSAYDIHSIEQPIRQGNPKEMAKLCQLSPIPIALDEELIGIYSHEAKEKLLREIMPAYIILKPALCGGFSGSREWISLATQNNVGWWVTSALESNVGLNALAQWVATLDTTMPQGLGTGNLYTNNFITPVYLEGDVLRYNPAMPLDKSQFDNLDWRS